MQRAGTLLAAFVCLWMVFGDGPVLKAEPMAEELLAGEILQAVGLDGGLIVHLDCDGGALTAALGAEENYLVHGLDPDPGDIDTARGLIRSLGVYGRITAELHTGNKLPFVDNLVNLVVSQAPVNSAVMAEIMRILAPNGTAYIGNGSGGWVKTIKPRPAEIDDWTHYLYDASNNAVAQDTVVGPPERIKWIGSPKWSRQHDFIASVNGHVSAGGRVFYIIDEGSKVSPQLPVKWSLVARDAFNGTILWKRAITSWVTQLWPNKSGPAQIPRRLVAVGDYVYVTLSLDNSEISKLDAATGETVWTTSLAAISGAAMAEELIYSDGTIFAVVKTSPSVTTWNEFLAGESGAKGYVETNYPWDEKDRFVTAIDDGDGSVLWRTKKPVAPLTLGADSEGVYFHDSNSIVALNRTDGSILWVSEPVVRRSPMGPKFGPTLVIHGDYIIFVGGDPGFTITGLSAKTGRILWSDVHDNSGYNCPHDLFVTQGRAWTGHIANTKDSGLFTGWDPNTGVKVEIPSDLPPTRLMHQRCYRSKATERYILTSRNGIEFVNVDLDAEQHWQQHHWTRGGCLYGFIPANGMIYTTPHNCACYLESMTFGFTALAAAHSDPNYPVTPPDEDRLLAGPAYGEPLGAAAGAEDWPTYRRDTNRSGSTDSIVPADLEIAWETPIGGKLSTMTIAGGRVFVASVDSHEVYALDEADGHIIWSYSTNSRVDSPPTFYRGRVIFGCNDGFVYCLRASDGALIWRFQAAPEKLKMTCFEQLESVWPVPGSVLVQNDIVYCVAGRNMFVDGGLRLLQLDPVTGDMIAENVMDEFDPVTGENLQVHIKHKNMPVSKPDILSCDGQYIYMRTQRFDLAGNREQIAPVQDTKDALAAAQYGPYMHLFCPTGFLDDEYTVRTYWMWGMTFGGGASAWHKTGKHAPAGRVLAIGDTKVFGFGRRYSDFGGQDAIEYQVFCAEKYPESESVEYLWNDENVPMLGRAITLADRILFVAGPPDVVDEDAALYYWRGDPDDPAYDPNIPQKLAQQDAALNDELGGVLWAMSVDDGHKMAAYNLESMPVWDGMIGANGKLFIAMKNGKVKCFTGSNYPPVIDVGPDKSSILTAPAFLDATVSDDGIPLTNPGDPCSLPVGITTRWSLLTGPAEAIFSDANSVDTSVSFSEWGDYTLRLTADDGGASYDADLNIHVLRPGDMDLDDDVDEFDLEFFAGGWMLDGCDWFNDWCGGANQAADGKVNSASFAVISLNWLLGVEPAVVTGLEATGGPAEISLDWKDNDEPDLDGYNVYRSGISGSGYTRLNSSPVTSSDYADVTADAILTWYYVVTAVDISGYESPSYSNEASASAGPQPILKLSADEGIIQDVNDLVRRWNDQSGSGNNAIQSTGGWRPAYVASAINGKPAIDFAGTGIHLDVADSTDINRQASYSAKTLVVVFKTGSDITTKQVVWEQGGGKVGGLNFYIHGSLLYINGWAIKIDDAFPEWGLTELNTGVSANTVYVASMVMDSAAGTFEGFVNGVSIGVYAGVIDVLPKHGNDCAFGHTEGTSRFHNGGHKAVAEFGGLVAEFYEYNAALTPAERGILEGFLMDKYGL